MARAGGMKSFLRILLVVGASVAPSRGDDWPTWRHDAARTAASPDTLPADLVLRWVLELPPPRPAWPAGQRKLQFDALYEPVVMGQTVFVGSMVRIALRTGM